jgi:hypothetical protein
VRRAFEAAWSCIFWSVVLVGVVVVAGIVAPVAAAGVVRLGETIVAVLFGGWGMP